MTDQANGPTIEELTERETMLLAGISTAAFGYWKEGDWIHPDYDTQALRDVAGLYAKYDKLYKELQSISSQPVPVEPECVKVMRDEFSQTHSAEAVSYIDSLQSALRVAMQERDRHMGAVKAYIEDAEAMKKRAEQAEKDRDICYISLQDMRRRLHEIASLVTDPRLDEKHTA